MSEIESNYPRAQVAISDEKANLVDVNMAGGAGSLAVWVITLAFTLHNIGPLLGFRVRGHETIYGLLIMVIIGAVPFFFVNLYKWGSQAHYALCLLRGYRTKISSKLVGIGCALSFFLAAIPIWLVFDFLVVHSDPETNNAPAFSWSSAGLLFFVPYTLSWLWIIAQLLPFWSPTVLYAMAFGRYLLLVFAVYSGTKAISRIDNNLRSLAKVVRQQVSVGEPEATSI